jgi:DNA-binding NtrC family response regulator
MLFLALDMQTAFLMAAILTNKSILIIDDDARMLKALERVLADEGATVTCVDLAVDAFKMLAARPRQYDLIITDFRMPFVSGIKAVDVIHKVLPELPIIVLTAYGDAKVKAECLQKGAVAFLEKPIAAPHLLEVVGKIIEAKQSGLDNRPFGSASK